MASNAKWVCLGCGESLPWGGNWNMTNHRYCPHCGADRMFGMSDEPRRLSPATAYKLLTHHEKLAELGLKVETVDTIQKSIEFLRFVEISLELIGGYQLLTGQTVSIPAIVQYLKDELNIHGDEIIQLRLNNLE